VERGRRAAIRGGRIREGIRAASREIALAEDLSLFVCFQTLRVRESRYRGARASNARTCVEYKRRDARRGNDEITMMAHNGYRSSSLHECECGADSADSENPKILKQDLEAKFISSQRYPFAQPQRIALPETTVGHDRRSLYHARVAAISASGNRSGRSGEAGNDRISILFDLVTLRAFRIYLSASAATRPRVLFRDDTVVYLAERGTRKFSASNRIGNAPCCIDAALARVITCPN